MKIGKYLRRLIVIALVGTPAILAAQSTASSGITGDSTRTSQMEPYAMPPLLKMSPGVMQELDTVEVALAMVPADPLLNGDPLGFITRPSDNGVSWLEKASRLRLGATYTVINQYATETPPDVRHDQVSGRLDFNGNLAVYDGESTSGSIGLLARSGTNIGMSQQFNLSDAMGSGVFLNSLQGGGEQQPITLNILYWRQDFLHKRLSIYVGKVHPNQHIGLSLYNDDETTQFLNGVDNGNLTVPYAGAFAGGAAVEYQFTPHLYLHSVAVDTVGGPQDGIATLVDKKYFEATELGWFTGKPGSGFQSLRLAFWRDDTKDLGSGFGVGFGFDHEYRNGWAPLGRVGFATDTGGLIKRAASLGVTNIRPFGRRGDMFGVAMNYTEPNHTGRHHESLFETFYRLRLTNSIEVGPDLQVTIHPTYAAKAYTSVLPSARMRIIF
ncbi:carbohydrate porin [Granulicella mallensis]|uniref:Porin n=1 Tax=Granulicella mallensis TaxID=940614 RepID=A0A7W7ZU62_9BACT|nr:carbohydrate porin [Granulicella mallensis]MBB5066234.1 porin [Granulicella mallensis]